MSPENKKQYKWPINGLVVGHIYSDVRCCHTWYVTCSVNFYFYFFYPVLVFKVLRLSLKPG